MRFLRQSLTGLFLLCLALGLLAYAGHMVLTALDARRAEQPRLPERREREFAVRVITARTQTAAPVLTAYGEVQSRRTLELRAQSGGRVVTLDPGFVEGGRVRAGQLLVQIDPADAKAALARARADLSDAQDERREARRAITLTQDELEAAREQAALQQRALSRQQDLQARGVGTSAAVENAELAAVQARQSVLGRRQSLALAEARIDQSETRLDRARIARNEAQRRLDDTRVTAGFDGRLSEVGIVAGRVVAANERLADLIDDRALEVAFRVSIAQYGRLLDADGKLRPAPVRATLDAYGQELTAAGTVTRDSAAVGAARSGRLVFAALDRAQGFKPGDFVTVHVQEPRLRDVVRLPAAALGGDGQVLLMEADGRLSALTVTLLRRQGDDVLVRATGLAGRDVVAARTPLLGPGIKVRPLAQAQQPRTRTNAALDADGFVDLSPERRQALVAHVRARTDLPEAARARLLAQLDQPQVPARMVQRLERRMGG